MLGYIEYLSTPTGIATVLVIVLLITQLIGELLEFKGIIVPEILKIRKYFIRKKKERETLSKITDMIDVINEIPETLSQCIKLFNNINTHYNDDNITKRDEWMSWVNKKSEEYDSCVTCVNELETMVNEKAIEYDGYKNSIEELKAMLDKNNAITLSLLIDNKRNTIIDFASKVIDEKYPVTKEQFNRVLKIHREYEEIIEEYNMTNGEVDIAIRIIQESYKQHLMNHTFVEDVRGY